MVSRQIAVAWALATLVACAQTRGEVTLINRSNEPVRVTLTVARQRFEIATLNPNDRTTWVFAPYGDSSYQVHVVSDSGMEISQRLGYVTDGHASRDEIYILDGKLHLEPGFEPAHR